jgi:two-component system response regulator HydG
MVENNADFISPDLPPDKRQLPAFMAPFSSDSYRDVLRMASRVAKFDSSVLLSGETGVGKEIVARYIHWLSPRSEKPMLTINCGALPETLLESELFGHKAGSFTGAIRDRVGLFEQAARGTVFLDEIGDISKTIQLKLLRVLQEREILRIGENIPRRVDIRTIAATHQDLNSAADEGKFREDLLYRLRVVEINVPSLRERIDDIKPLTDYFIERLARKLRLPDLNLDQDCLERFQTYSWPGNVRELQNAIEHAAIISGDGNVKLKHLPPQITGKTPARISTGKLRSLAKVESEYIQEILRLTGGNRTRAAGILRISPATLWRKLKRLDD